MPEYRNVGATDWRRGDGSLVPPGGTFDATSREHARIQRRPHYGARCQLVEGAVVAPGERKEWPLKMDPKKYLELHPEGPKSKLARKLLAGKDAP